MNLLVSTDRRYLRITETMIYSLSRFTKVPLSIWCLCGELSTKDKESFNHNLMKLCGVSAVYYVDMRWVNGEKVNLPINIKRMGIETYYRLFAQFVLPKKLDRILWLDSDIIVKGEIDELYQYPIKGFSLVAYSNMGEPRNAYSNRERLGLPLSVTYFNAGVLLLNLEYLRATTTKEDIIRFCHENAYRFDLQDQDALNMLYCDSAKVITDQRFNCMITSPQDFSSPDIVEQASIIHYAGKQKPWKIKWQNNNSRFWWEARREIGLVPKEKSIIVLGRIWDRINGNRLERSLCMPYYFLKNLVRRSG